jgi:hypothetical protein
MKSKASEEESSVAKPVRASSSRRNVVISDLKKPRLPPKSSVVKEPAKV